MFSTNVPLVEATKREGASWALDRAAALGRLIGGEPMRWGFEANEHPPVLRTARPLRQPHRRGRVPPRLASPHAPRGGARTALAPLALRGTRGARGARGALHHRDAGGGGLRVPDHDDLRRRPDASNPARAGRGVGAAGHRDHLRAGADRGEREGQRALRDGDDREAGWLGRAREHHRRARQLALRDRERGRRRARSTSSPATSGSARRRCATSSWCSRRPTRGSRASCCRGSCPTAAATPFTYSG